MSEGEKKLIVALDGPAGAGKSTIAKELAKRLEISYLDTGAMYRALTLKALREKIPLEDEEVLVALAKRTSVSLQGDVQAGLKVFLDKKDVTEEIRTREVTNNTFYIARTKGVREVMLGWQRSVGEKESLVAEGRDIGTVVFPNASHKFYLDANFEERARRRILELEGKGQEVDAQRLSADLKERDNKDLSRKVAPLKKAEDAILIDSTFLSIDGVVEKILGYITQDTRHKTQDTSG